MSVDKFKNYAIMALLLVIAVLLLFQKCESTKGCKDQIIYVDKPADAVLREIRTETPIVQEKIRYEWRDRIDTLLVDNGLDPQSTIAAWLDTVNTDSIIQHIGESRLILAFDDWITKKVFRDTISEDSNFVAVITDSLWMNKITKRKFELQNLRETSTQYLDNRTRKLMLGFHSTASVNLFDFGPSAGFMNKQNQLFQYQYDLLGQNHRVAFMGTITIRKRPKLPLPIP